jgi:hypothetical protein
MNLNKTEESVFTLLSLYILASQAFESLFGEENILHSNFDYDNNSFHDLVNDTIHEALVYQILLKACAYMDEWNDVFGVKTEVEDSDKIRFIKLITKPAHKEISSWKQLKDFRNQAIAHNHRDKQGKNIYLFPRSYHSPQSNAEIFFLLFCLKQLTDVINFYFPSVAKEVLINRDKKEKLGSLSFMSMEDIKLKTSAIENEIRMAILQERVLYTATHPD